MFFGKFATETNTFSNIPTTLGSFELIRGEDLFAQPSLQRWKAEMFSCGVEVIAGLSAYAEPGAPMQQTCYERISDELIATLIEAMPVDAVLLHLHGAMVSQKCDDCEGDLLSRIREIVGRNIPIGAMLDPHAHLTPQMVDSSDILAFMKEYPHIDGAERTADVVRILQKILSDGVRPVPAIVDCRMMGFYPTQLEPMRTFVDGMRQLEGRGNILDISLVHGFPFGDTAYTGTKVLVYSDKDPVEALQVATDLRDRLWAIRKEAMLTFSTIEEALSAIPAGGGRPVVIGDFADNPGGGAPGDNVCILRAVLDRQLSNIAIGLVCDPMAVLVCHDIGLGGQIDLRVGGKTGRGSGAPIDLDVEVMGLARSAEMTNDCGDVYPLGDTAWVRHAGVDVVLASRRMQLLHPSGLTHIGLNPTRYSAIIVKSSNHFADAFSPIAEKIFFVSAEGALNTNLSEISYRKLESKWYPKSENPSFDP